MGRVRDHQFPTHQALFYALLHHCLKQLTSATAALVTAAVSLWVKVRMPLPAFWIFYGLLLHALLGGLTGDP